MINHGIQERWNEMAARLLQRGLISDFLNNPGGVISQVLSPPAATTQEPAKVETTAQAAPPAPAPTTTAAAAPAPAPTTTQQAAPPPPPATTAAPAQQPAPTTAGTMSREQAQPGATTPAAQVPTSTKKLTPEQPTTVPAANPPVINNPAAATTPAADGAPSSVSNVAAASSSSVTGKPPGVSSVGASKPVVPQSSATIGTDLTRSGGGSTTSQTPVPPNSESQMNGGTTNQTPLVATGVILGLVVFMGISLLLFWCYRRRRKANLHHHAALPPESPANEYESDPRFRDDMERNSPSVTENRAISSREDRFIIQHPQPQGSDTQSQPESLTSQHPPATSPYSGEFTLAQAQLYAQSHGAFSCPIPPIPEPSPIRMFRWPTRSSRSGHSAPSVFSGFRSPKPPSRAMSRASRSTMSSMLWHGRRDVARRTLNQAPSSAASQRNNNHLSVHNNSPESTMPEGLHTPILDWLQWIRGHQSEGGDPEMNHRKSFASTTESSVSEGSLASSGVFSPTLLSWPPPADDQPPVIDAEALAFLPIPLSIKRQSSNADTMVEGRRVSFR